MRSFSPGAVATIVPWKSAPMVTIKLGIIVGNLYYKSSTDLCTRLQRVSDRCAVARCVSRRRGNTGRQRQVVP